MLTITLILRRAATFGVAVMLFVGCGTDHHSAGEGGGSSAPPIPEACATPATGCPCTSRKPARCGVTLSRVGDTLTCSEGERACTDGAWGDCIGDVTTQIYAPPPTAPGVHTEGLAMSASSCNDACDPYCQQVADTPDDLIVSRPLVADATGLSLYSAGFTGGNCPEVVVKPPGAKLEITSISEVDGTVTPSTVSLNAVCGAAATPVDPTWSTDQPDRSSVDDQGLLKVFSGVAGDINVSAASQVNTATQAVPVTVNINEFDAAIAAADKAALQTRFSAAGSAADPAKTLYPYKGTVFPLDLKAPLVQWLNGATAAASKSAPLPDNVQVALRYPAGSATPTFWYSKIFKNEPYDGALVKNPAGKTAAPAWSIPQFVWEAFSRTAKGQSGEIVVQRSVGTTLYRELVIPVTFATKALRGTVYYTQYLRRLYRPTGDVCSGQTDLPNTTYDPLQPGATICPVGNCTHASDVYAGSTTRSIDMSTSKAANLDPFNNQGGCPVCHSVSANGNRYVAGSNFLQTFGAPQVAAGTSTGFVNDITATPSGAAKFTVVGEASNYSAFRTAQDWDSRGFAYAALTPDGALALQGPYPWGNTENGVVNDNLQTDKAYRRVGQIAPMFLVPTDNPGTSVQFATTVPLAATRSGDVLTATAGSAIPNVDGYALAVDDSVLVKDQADARDNGIYTVTELGTCGSASLTTSTTLTATATSAVQAAALAFDNDTNTRWESNYKDPQTLTLDLGGNQTIGRVRIEWEVASAQTYTVDVATNPAGPWTTIVTVTSNPSSTDHRVDDFNCLNATGRYVRMAGTARTTGYGYSIYEMDVFAPAPGGSPYKLTRRSDARTPAVARDGWLRGNAEVRVTRGIANYAKVFRLASSSSVPSVNTESLTFIDIGADPLPVMMTPTISPDGSKIAYVNGDADTYPTSDSAAWRKSLTLVSLDQAARHVALKRRLLNNWVANTGGKPIKWPFFESDSRSLIYVQSTEDSYCHSENSTDDDGRACLESVYGNAAPTTRGRWKGSLYSLDTGAGNPSATAAELSKLNDAEDPKDADKAYQPTVLKDESGGYRWVIFTSPRSYGNQINQIDTHFSCGATMLWVAAIDPKTADGTDRSHPAFFLPGQNVAPITDETHFVNERGYLVPSPCKSDTFECSTSDECCGTSQCKVDSISMTGVPSKVCKPANSCGREGDACLTNADCCGGTAACVAQKCVAVPKFTQSGVYPRDYEASCAPGFKPRWGLLLFHLTTPGDSKISFAAQTAASQADLATAMPVALGASTDDNYGAAAGALDVGAKLEADETPFSLNFLRVTITLTPSTNGAFAPILHDWEQRYSCQPAE